MRIGIEAQRIFRPNKHGMDFVALETIRVLQQTDKTNDYFIFVSPGEDRCLYDTENMHIVEVNCPTYILWEQVALPFAAAKAKVDILHCTSNTAPLFSPMPLVLTLHDIIFLEDKKGKNASLYQTLGWYYRRWIVPVIVSKCKKIITVSHTEYELINHRLKLVPGKLTVIHNGYSKQYHPIEEAYHVTQKYCAEKEYLFFLGNTDPRKNTQRVFQAYTLYLKKSTKQLPLIVTGLSQSTITRILVELGLEDIGQHIISTGYVPGDDLPYLYNSAFVFLNPSLREGFGIPILESMACGTPVITSNISSMPEVAGEGGLLVNPYKEQDIADRIIALENNPALYAKQVAYGLEHVKDFSWERTALSILAIYKEFKNKRTP